jgi:hypothetical protein
MPMTGAPSAFSRSPQSRLSLPLPGPNSYHSPVSSGRCAAGALVQWRRSNETGIDYFGVSDHAASTFGLE